MLIRDRYRLEDVLGRGGMGEVWRAHDEALGRAVAVKLLTVGADDETAVARFTAEARTAGRLNHPNTVAVYDFGSVDGLLFLVMELVDGHSLATEVAAFRRLDLPRVAGWGGQIASGLAAAHREGIVHRDIKPANLLITRDETVKIGDFGIARFAHEASAGVTSTGLIIGTATYLAPERALGRTAGPPADMYALGCVLYELLTGRPPFTSDAPAALLHQHVDVAPVDVRDHRGEIPDALAGLVHRLLAKLPEERPTADEAARELGTALTRTVPADVDSGPRTTRIMAPLPFDDGHGVPAPPRQPPSTRRLPTRQAASCRRYVLLGVAAAAAAAVAFGVAADLDTQPRGHLVPSHQPTAHSATPTDTPTPVAPPTQHPAARPVPHTPPGQLRHQKGEHGKDGKGPGKQHQHP